MSLSELAPPQVSVLIRVRNEEHALRQLFECLRIQKLDRPFEVVVIDNESDDESAEVARTAGARVFTFPRSLFGYGRAINYGVQLCRGDLIVLLSAHSWPHGDDWLSRMIDYVESDALAAAYCRQFVGGRACRQEKARAKLFAKHDYKLDRETLMRRCRSGEDVFEVCCFSNSAAIFRREVVLRFPFRELPGAEDRAFVLDCVMAGNSIAYLSTASVNYQHPGTFRNSYRIGWACNISRHLIRELGNEVVGADRLKSELIGKVARLIGKPLEITSEIMEALLRDRSQLGRTTQYAAMSCVLSLGGIVGELTWRRYRKTMCCGSSMLSIAKKGTNIVVPERMLPTV